MILTFERSVVEELLQHSINSSSWRPTFEGKSSEKPGLWLVGDRGIYLMSNGNPGKMVVKPGESRETHVICYADQINPLIMEVNEWYENKVNSFGPDDGCDLLVVGFVEHMLEVSQGDKVALEVTPEYVDVAIAP